MPLLCDGSRIAFEVVAAALPDSNRSTACAVPAFRTGSSAPLARRGRSRPQTRAAQATLRLTDGNAVTQCLPRPFADDASDIAPIRSRLRPLGPVRSGLTAATLESIARLAAPRAQLHAYRHGCARRARRALPKSPEARPTCRAAHRRMRTTTKAMRQFRRQRHGARRLNRSRRSARDIRARRT